MKTSIPSHWDLLLLATATVKSIKRCHTITELVVVWSVCSVCTSVAKSKVDGPHIQLDTLQRFTLFVLAVARSSKTSVHFFRDRSASVALKRVPKPGGQPGELVDEWLEFYHRPESEKEFPLRNDQVKSKSGSIV